MVKSLSYRKYHKHRTFKTLPKAKKYAHNIRKKGYTGSISKVSKGKKLVGYRVYKYS